MRIFWCLLSKNQKFYQCVFALRAFLILFFKHPFKKGLFLSYCAWMFCFFHRFYENYKILKILPKAFCFNRKNTIYKNRKILPKGFCFNTNFNFLDENKYTVDSSILELVFWVKKHKSCKFRRLQEKYIFCEFCRSWIESKPRKPSPQKVVGLYIVFMENSSFSGTFWAEMKCKTMFFIFSEKNKKC